MSTRAPCSSTGKTIFRGSDATTCGAYRFSATTGIALRLAGIPEDRLVYLSLLPQLLTGVGVIENGTPVPVDQMAQRIRTEILSLNATFSVNADTGRHELVVRGAEIQPPNRSAPSSG